MNIHTKKIMKPVNISMMIDLLDIHESGHPGDGWFSSIDLSKASGMDVTGIKRRCDKMVDDGIYESCRRKIGRSIITFYRLKPDRCSTKVNHERNPVRSSPTARIPSGKSKRKK